MIGRTTFSTVALVAAGAALAGCHGKPPPPRIALVAGAAGFGDRSANDAARAGLEACRRETGAEIAAVTARDPRDAGPQLVLMATQGYDTVIALGYPMADGVARAARRFQGTHFMLIGAAVDEPNVVSVGFADQDGAFLAGALAAMVSRTHRVAFVGGADAGPVRAYASGYAAGVREADPRASVAAVYTGSFTDRAAARRAAETLLGRGADVVFAAAGPAGLGAIDAVRATRGALAIGADSDQDALAPGRVLTSVVEHADVAAHRVCEETVAQKPASGRIVLGLADGGVALTPFRYTKNLIGPARLARLERIRRAVLAGTLVPPASPAALARFRPVPIR